MFEREIKFISDFTLNKIKKLGSLFTFDKLAGLNIHPAIIQYVSAELDYIIYEDRNKLLQNSVFDYSSAEILNYFNQIGKEIKKNKKIAYEDIKILIVQAVSFNANFVARPNWSLSKLIYHEKDLFSAQELRLMLNYTYYYGYIKDILSGYLAKKRIANVSLAEFELLLSKIDKEILAKQESKVVDMALGSLGDFFNVGSINKSKVPLNAVEFYLKEKNLVDILLALKNVLHFEEKQKVEIKEIKNIIAAAPVEENQEQQVFDFEKTVEPEVNTEMNVSESELPEEETIIRDNDQMNFESGEIFDKNEVQEEKISESDDNEDNTVIEENNEINYETEKILDSSEIQELNPPDTKQTKDETIIEEHDEVNSESDEADGTIEINRINDAESEQPENEAVIENNDEVNFETGNIHDTSEESEDKKITVEEEPSITVEENEIEIDYKVQDETQIDAQVVNKNGNKKIIESHDEDENEEYFDEEESERDSNEPVQGLDVQDSEVKDESDETEEFTDYDRIVEEENDETGDDDLVSENNIEEENNKNGYELVTSSFDLNNSKNITASEELEAEDKSNNLDVKIKDESAEDLASHEPENYKKFEDIEKIEKEIEKLENKIDPVTKNKIETDIFRYITNRDMERIISNIFNEDRDDFTNTMEKIAECGNYDEAIEILKGVFFTYRVSPYTRDAITLTNVVSFYFNQAS